MKKILALTVLILATSVVFAQRGNMTASSTVVTTSAVIPEYIGFTDVNVAPVSFNFIGAEDALDISKGWHNAVASVTAPSWNLEYNLLNRTITVCAYASDLTGVTAMNDGQGMANISAQKISGQSLQGNRSASFGTVAACADGGTGSAMLLDSITSAHASTVNQYGVPRVEGFSSLSLTPGRGNSDYVPVPDSYRGTLYIVAQAI